MSSLEVANGSAAEDHGTPQEVFVLTQPDYNAVKPEDDTEEAHMQ